MGKIRYIGKTVNIKARLYGHISESKKHNGNRHVLNWIFVLLKNGEKPILEIIEITNEEHWEERERYWISYYKSIGCSLCNLADGGIGGIGGKAFSEKEKRKRADFLRRIASKTSEKEKYEIWNCILNGMSWIEIKKIYPQYSRATDFHVKNGRVWRHITNLPIIHANKYKGYLFNNGYYVIRRTVLKKKKTIFSSKNELDVIEYLKRNKSC